MVETGL
ncbi:unnamed protein product, partial [Didymodactylos carnosus]